jgi:citrate lyase subunit beta-like protein
MIKELLTPDFKRLAEQKLAGRPPIRTFFYTPAYDQKKIIKAVNLEVDCLCLDLEDGTPYNMKNKARDNVIFALKELHFKAKDLVVRINPFDSEDCLKDLEAILPFHPSGIVIPKVESEKQIQEINNIVNPKKVNDKKPPIELFVLIESPKGLLNIKEIAQSENVAALMLGTEDLSNSLGTGQDKMDELTAYARNQLLINARAFGLQAIDRVSFDIKDKTKLNQDALDAKNFGFDGKQIIHPDQIETVKQVFTPTDKQIEMAINLIKEYKENFEQGRTNYISKITGQVMEKPIIMKQLNIIFLAVKLGILDF